MSERWITCAEDGVLLKVDTKLGFHRRLDIDLGKDSKALCLQGRDRGIQSLLIGQFECRA